MNTMTQGIIEFKHKLEDDVNTNRATNSISWTQIYKHKYEEK